LLGVSKLEALLSSSGLSYWERFLRDLTTIVSGEPEVALITDSFASTMADPLSITASIVGIIAATSQGIELLSNTIQNIRNVPESIRSIQRGIQQLKPLLTKLEFVIKEEPTELILSTEIRDALGVCNRACTEFNVSLTHWTRRSSSEKTSVLDNAKIGIFRQGRIRVLNDQLNQSIKILNVTLDTATLYVLYPTYHSFSH